MNGTSMATARTETPDRYERAMTAIDALLAERGLGRYATFSEVGEGEQFPDGTESMSGFVIDEAGCVHFFWTDWDEDRGRPTFGIWRAETPSDAWLSSGEYRAARASVGLDG